ncbi:MAG: ABC transporter substrate-binding protein, partial [Ruminococcus sp.]|nr:ABC transporter substrate-binding protein [Ruminococcus sp.]
MRQILRKILISVLLSFSAMSCVSGFAKAEKTGTSPDFSIINPADENIISYSRYRSEYSGVNRPDSEIKINAGDFVSDKFPVENINGRNAVVWKDSADNEITCIAEIPETGIYCLEISYFSFESGNGNIELSMSIDGEIPYNTASRLSLGRVWVNENDIYTDSRRNQIRPAQVQQEMWQKCFFGDSDGMTSEPLFFYLEKGTHEITFTSGRADFAIEYMIFRNPPEIPSYSDYRSEISSEDNASGIIRIEAESAVRKSDPVLAPASDNSSYLTSPSDPVKIVYNTLGGENWKKPLQWVSWEVTPEKSGFYRIGVKARQNQKRGFYSGRRIYIDGKIPCRELEYINFPYDTGWNLVVPQTENGDDIYIYLDSGRTHTITMECVTGETGKFISRLDDTVSELDDYYRRIVMITGTSPDKYTDYYIQEKIPELIEVFGNISGELRDIQNGIESLSGVSGSEASVLENTAVILEKCIKKPLKIPDYLSQIKDS